MAGSRLLDGPRHRGLLLDLHLRQRAERERGLPGDRRAERLGRHGLRPRPGRRSAAPPTSTGVALVLGDLWWSPERRVEVSPRNVLRAQCERAAAAGLHPVGRRRVRVLRLRRHLRGRPARRATATSSRCTARRPTTPSTASTATRSCSASCGGRSSASGIPVESIKSEMGHGQYEITFQPTAALAAADRGRAGASCSRARSPRSEASSATFLARLAPAGMGSSGHIHLSLAGAGRREPVRPRRQGPVGGRPPVHRRHHAPRAGVHGCSPART